MLHVPEQLKEAYKAARKAQWSVTVKGDQHLLWVSPAGNRVSTPSTSIRCSRTVKNYLKDLSRAGLVLPNAGGRRRKSKRKALVSRGISGVQRTA